jgi:rubredoxin
MNKSLEATLAKNDICPRCFGELDTGWECNTCGFDAKPLVDKEEVNRISLEEQINLFEFLVIKLSEPIINPDWNFCNNLDGGETHRTLAELGTLGYQLVSVIKTDDGKYLYYLQRFYDKNDGINRSLPFNYNHSINE